MDGKKEPYTTSEIIAECAEVTHHTIQELLRKHKADFESYGIIAFEMRKLDGRGIRTLARPRIRSRIDSYAYITSLALNYQSCQPCFSCDLNDKIKKVPRF